MILNHAQQWKDEGQSKSAPWLQVFSLPIRTFQSTLGIYHPCFTLRYALDRPTENEPGLWGKLFDSETFIDFDLAGGRVSIDNLFPFVLLQGSRMEMGVTYQNHKLDGKSMRTQSEYGTRKHDDGFVIIEGDLLSCNTRYVSVGYKHDDPRYKRGLHQIKRTFELGEQLAREIPGISEEGKYALEILSKKFQEEFEYKIKR